MSLSIQSTKNSRNSDMSDISVVALSVTGNVTGNVTGDLTGNVIGDLNGNVTGDLTGNVIGDLNGNVTGDLTGNVTGDLTGNVTGDLTGNVTGDLTGNVLTSSQPSITSISNLTTVGTLSSGSITSGFGSINIGTSTLSAGNASLGDLTVGGNLTVNGNTTTVNSNVMIIDDPIITLGDNTTSPDNKDRGIEFKYYDSISSSIRTGFMGYDDSESKFRMLVDATNTSEVFNGTTGTLVANIEGNVTGNNLTLQATGTTGTQYELLNIKDQNNTKRFTLYSWVQGSFSTGSYLQFASPGGTSIDMYDIGPWSNLGQIQLNSTDSTSINNSYLRLNSNRTGGSGNAVDGFVHLKAADISAVNGSPGSIKIQAGNKYNNGSFVNTGEIKLLAGSCDFNSNLDIPGGKITLETQKGTQNSGNGGDVEVLLGEGNNKGGRGGDFKVLGRMGGADNAVASGAVAGNGSSIYLNTGNGGTATGSTNTGGNGGDMIVTLGQKGTGINSNSDGNDGEFKVVNSTGTMLDVTTNITRVTNSFSADSYKFLSFTFNLSNIQGASTNFSPNQVLLSIGQLDTLLSNNVTSVTGGNRICVKNIIINQTDGSSTIITPEIHISSDNLNQYKPITNSLKLIDYTIGSTQNVTFYDNINKVGSQDKNKLYLVASTNVITNLNNVDVNISIEYIVL